MNRDPFGPWPLRRRCLWALTTCLVCALAGPGFVRSLKPAHDTGVDFFQEWASARNALSGLPVYMNQAEAAERYLGIRVDPGDESLIMLNAHPPTSVLLALPFAYLDYPDATLVWNLMSLAALAIAVWLVVRELKLVFSPWSLLPIVALLLVCNPLRQHVNQGQINLVLLMLMTGIWIAERSNQPWRAGVLLGTATAIKLFPGFFFLYFVARRRWKSVLAGIGGFLGITVLTAAVLGFATYKTYVTEVLPYVSSRFRGAWINASLPGLWSKLFDPGTGEHARHVKLLLPSPSIARAGAVLSCAVVVALWLRAVWRAETRLEHDHAFGLTLTAMFLVSPITWEHYLPLLLLPLTLLWLTLCPSTKGRAPLLVILLFFWLNPVLWWILFIPGTSGVERGVATPLHTLSVLSIQCYALLGLFVLGLQAGGGQRDP
jgi:hypothetical protein